MNILGSVFHARRPPTHPDHGKEARHLLRAILRECTYLPDAEARVEIKRQVLQTFRATERKAKGYYTLDFSEPAPPTRQIRSREDEVLKIQKWLNKGYKGLRQLQRANEGELRPLGKVLHYTYGRGGRRRHELLQPLLSADVVVADSRSLEEHLKNAPSTQEPQKWDLTTIPAPDVFGTPIYYRDVVQYPISDRYGRLKTLLQSQSRTKLPNINGRPIVKIRSEICEIPAKNIWGRSMPRRRAKNMVRKWYNLVLSRLLPPLPEHEWMHLQGKINGTIKWDGPPQRRARSLMKPDSLTTFDLERVIRLHDGSVEPRNSPERDHEGVSLDRGEIVDLKRLTTITRSRFADEMSNRWLASQAAKDEVMQDLLKDSIGVIRPLSKKLARDRGHRITHRFMKRLWAQIFAVCPMVTKDESSDHWKVVWGSQPKASKTIPPTDSFLPLFPAATTPSDPSERSEEAMAGS